MIDKIKERIADIEKAIEGSMLNHNGLLARLDEAKVLLDMAAKAAHAVAPGSAVDIALTAADSVADALSAAHD
jgi:hypothetical protein